MSDDDLLASDDERDAVVARLQQALVDGRLTADEAPQRIEDALRARTRGDLARLVQDLPGALPAARAAASLPVEQRAAAAGPTDLRKAWTGWAIASSVTFVVWGITSITTASLLYPWFLWVAGPWGAVLLVKTLLGRSGDA